MGEGQHACPDWSKSQPELKLEFLLMLVFGALFK